jgi:natural product precursor
MKKINLKGLSKTLSESELKNIKGGYGGYPMCWSEIKAVIDYLTYTVKTENSIAQAGVIIEGCTAGTIQYNPNC